MKFRGNPYGNFECGSAQLVFKVTLPSTDMWPENFCSCPWGPSGGSTMNRAGSKDPHQLKRKLARAACVH